MSNQTCALLRRHVIPILTYQNSSSKLYLCSFKLTPRSLPVSPMQSLPHSHGIHVEETACRSLLKQLEILTIPCQYILSLMTFIISNRETFQTNSSIPHINTTNKHHLHRQNANLPCCQKSALYAGIKIFNSLPPSMTILKNDKAKFKAT